MHRNAPPGDDRGEATSAGESWRPRSGAWWRVRRSLTRRRVLLERQSEAASRRSPGRGTNYRDFVREVVRRGRRGRALRFVDPAPPAPQTPDPLVDLRLRPPEARDPPVDPRLRPPEAPDHPVDLRLRPPGAQDRTLDPPRSPPESRTTLPECRAPLSGCRAGAVNAASFAGDRDGARLARVVGRCRSLLETLFLRCRVIP